MKDLEIPQEIPAEYRLENILTPEELAIVQTKLQEKLQGKQSKSRERRTVNQGAILHKIVGKKLRKERLIETLIEWNRKQRKTGKIYYSDKEYDRPYSFYQAIKQAIRESPILNGEIDCYWEPIAFSEARKGNKDITLPDGIDYNTITVYRLDSWGEYKSTIKR